MNAHKFHAHIDANVRSACSADFQVCVPRKHSGLVAGFQTRNLCDLQCSADLEVGDTAGLEACATTKRVRILLRSADFQVCRIAGFQTRNLCDLQCSADSEVGDTAGLEACATRASLPFQFFSKQP